MAKIIATLTITLVTIYSSEDELPEEVQGKGVKEFEKFILGNKEDIENSIIDFANADAVEINTVKVEEVDE